MSEHLQPGLHPDPDSLTAFIEGVLPEHERVECLAHLADCAQCREVVYLAQEPVPMEPLPVPVADRVSFWKRWLTPIPALSAAAVAAILVLSIALYRLGGPAANERVAAIVPTPTARVLKEPPVVAPPSMTKATAAVPARTVQKPAPHAEAPRSVPQSLSAQVQSRPGDSIVAPPLALPQPAPSDALTVNGSLFTPLPVASIPAPAPVSNAAASNAVLRIQSGIAGTITDQAGAVIPRAVVTVRPSTGAGNRNLTSDSAGHFQIAGLQPGHYELQLTAPGFMEATKQVDVRPDQVARVDSTLLVGTVTETVEVTAAAPMISTMSASRSVAMDNSIALPLPGKKAVETSVTQGKLMLATDATGALFLSQNAGKKWKTIKPAWQGKVASLATLPVPAKSKGPAFQLTTDSGAIWLSRDGRNWYAALTR